MKNRLIITICVAAAVVMTACSSNDAQKSAEGMLEKAEKYFSEGSYDRAKIAIDSLRKVYPGAVETRKKALKLFQDISLKEAQEDLALTDSIMQKGGLDYKYIKDKVEKDKAELRATAEELELLTRTKMKYDSLKVRFDMQCAKIKYIHKKQKE